MSFFTSLSGLQAAQTDMSTISHNLSNVQTNGFKKSQTQFADVIASTANSNPTQMVGSGVVVKAVRQQFGQGGFTQSSSALDVAIRARREAYAAPMDALRADIDAVGTRVTGANPIA